MSSLTTSSDHDLTIPESFDVFISHRSEELDTRLAEAIAIKLREAGVSCFVDTHDLQGGDNFLERIQQSIKEARIVIVLFDEIISTWVHFEASCAFFDDKLFPISINKADIPLPYSRVHYENISISDSLEIDENSINHIIDRVIERLLGPRKTRAAARLLLGMSNLFLSGLWVLAAVFVGILIGTSGDQVRLNQIHHLHVIFGSVVIGGQFFIALGFTRSVRSPSYREREFGFQITEKLFVIWLLCALIQPLLGLWYYCTRWNECFSFFGNSTKPVYDSLVSLSLLVYVVGLGLMLGGYLTARMGRELDRSNRNPYKIRARYFLASNLFLGSFLCTVGVIVIMLFHLPFS